jgi:hypothetical protein
MVALGLFLPLLGWSLLGFIALEILSMTSDKGSAVMACPMPAY